MRSELFKFRRASDDALVIWRAPATMRGESPDKVMRSGHLVAYHHVGCDYWAKWEKGRYRTAHVDEVEEYEALPLVGTALA